MGKVLLPECTLNVRGHWLYVRQCKKPETVAGTGIYRAEKDQLRSHVCEILGLGDRVGKKRTSRTRQWCRLRRIPRHIPLDIKVGDFVLVPENSPHHLLKVSPYCEYEFFVDESVILGVIE